MIICQRETERGGILVEGNRSQEAGHKHRFVPRTHSVLGGQRGIFFIFFFLPQEAAQGKKITKKAHYLLVSQS